MARSLLWLWVSIELILALKSIVASSTRMKGIGSMVSSGTSIFMSWNLASTASLRLANTTVAVAWMPPSPVGAPRVTVGAEL